MVNLKANVDKIIGESKLATLSLATAPVKAEVKDLNFFYGSMQALKNVNLEVPSNRVTALIGPSGCGKTTLLRCFNRMHDLYEDNRSTGEVILNPENVNLLDKNVDPIEVRMRISMVFQKPNPFPKSILDNVTYGLQLRGIKDRETLNIRAEKALRQAALWDEVKDRLSKTGTSLSGGQQQRLCLARALAVEPTILLMDEPTSALDPISTARIEELVMELKETVTILIVTHNMQQALRVADKTAFFLSGEMIESAPTRELFTSPKDIRTRDYVEGRFG